MVELAELQNDANCSSSSVFFRKTGRLGRSGYIFQAAPNLLNGLDQCDSVVWSLHKQLGAINQCSVLLSRENVSIV